MASCNTSRTASPRGALQLRYADFITAKEVILPVIQFVSRILERDKVIDRPILVVTVPNDVSGPRRLRHDEIDAYEGTPDCFGGTGANFGRM